MSEGLPEDPQGPPETLLSVVPERAFTPPSGGFELFVRGWRPACGWACGAILVVRGVAEPIALFALGRAVPPVDWLALTGFAALLIAARSFDKAKGTA